MSFINGGTQPFRYLTDGDGFTTGIKWRYWTRGMDDPTTYLNQYYLDNYGIRSLEQETVDSGEYKSMGIAEKGIGYKGTGQNVLYWNNARTGAFARGKINYIPLLPKEAIQVYWLYRGVKFSLNKLGLSTGTKGAKASVNVPQTFDGGYTFNRSGFRPFERIWNSSLPGGYSLSDFESNQAVWTTDRRGRQLSCSASVSYRGTSYLPNNQLIRFPKQGAQEDFGFEALFKFSASEFTAVDDSTLNWFENGYGAGGNDGTTIDFQLGSAFYFPEDVNDNDGYTHEKSTYSMEKIDIEGVPMIGFKDIHKGGFGGEAFRHKPLDGNIFDVIYERVND